MLSFIEVRVKLPIKYNKIIRLRLIVNKLALLFKEYGRNDFSNIMHFQIRKNEEN